MIHVANVRSTPVYLSDGSVVAGRSRRDVPEDDTTERLIRDGLLIVVHRPKPNRRKPRPTQ